MTYDREKFDKLKKNPIEGLDDRNKVMDKKDIKKSQKENTKKEKPVKKVSIKKTESSIKPKAKKTGVKTKKINKTKTPKKKAKKVNYNQFRTYKYSKKLAKKLEKWLAKGLSVRSFCGKMGVAESTLYTWCKKHPELTEAIYIGRNKGLAKWEQIGLLGTMGQIKGFNALSWNLNMQNRYNWKDNFDFSPPTSSTAVEERDLKESSSEKLKKLFKKYGAELGLR